MIRFLTKKNVLMMSSLYVLFLSSIFLFGGRCYENRWCKINVNNLLNLLPLIFFPFFSVLLLSLLTYRMRDEIFRAWTAFAVWWVPLSMIAITIAPEEIKGSISVPVKWPLAVFCAGTLLIVSLVIIIWKHYSLKKKNNL